MKKGFENAAVDISKAGTNVKILFGDLDCDGRLEIVAVGGNGLVPQQVACVMVFDLEGKLLWQRGEAPQAEGKPAAGYPAQVYDIDGDGFVEILCVMDKKFLILDGRSGEVKKAYALPGENTFDCILIANLSGDTFAHDIVLKDAKGNLRAMTDDFVLLWTYNGRLAEYPWALDTDRDGYDEIMTGYAMLDHNGEVLWSCGADNRADCIWTGYMDKNVLDGPRILVGGPQTAMYDAKGNILWRKAKEEGPVRLAVGKFTDEFAFQIAADGGLMHGATGEYLEKGEKRGLTILDAVNAFDGSGNDYILAYREGGLTAALYDGAMEVAYSFDRDGEVYHADLLGAGTEDIVVNGGGVLYIYASTQKDISKKGCCPIVQTKRLFRANNYTAGELITREFSFTKPMYKQSMQAYQESKGMAKHKTTVFLAGDSTVCDQDKEPFFGWGQVLGNYFTDEILVANYALSGRGAKSFIWEGHLDRLLGRMKKGDYLFIQFGHNDQKKDRMFYVEAFTEYTEIIRLYIREARKRGANPVLVTSMQRRDFDENGKNKNTLGDYPEALRKIAWEMRLPLIDLNAESKELYERYGVEGSKALFVHEKAGVLADFPDGIEDNTHFRFLGANEMSRIVCAGIRRDIPALAAYLK